MLNLSYVLEFIVDGLNNGSFTQQNPIIHLSETDFHIVFQSGYQLYTINEKFAEKILADNTFIANHQIFQPLNLLSNSRYLHMIFDGNMLLFLLTHYGAVF